MLWKWWGHRTMKIDRLLGRQCGLTVIVQESGSLGCVPKSLKLSVQQFPYLYNACFEIPGCKSMT